MKKILLVARDKAPSLALQQLAEKLLGERGIFYHCLLGHGEPLRVSLDEIRQVVRRVDVVITGMSSSPELAESEIAASEEAIKEGKKVIWYGILRPWFLHMRNDVRMLWVPDEFQRQNANNYYSASTEIVVIGNSSAIEPIAVTKMLNALQSILA